MSKHLSRRNFIKSTAVALVLAGCGRRQKEVGVPLSTPSGAEVLTSSTTSTATPTPPPSADGVVQAYLQAWEQGNFEAMYQLLSPESQSRIPFVQFFNLYLQTRRDLTATNLTTHLLSLLVETDQAAAAFSSVWSTVLFDQLAFEHALNLRLAAGRWWVVWEPTLVLPQLGQGVKLAFREELPNRGLIYDNLDNALALQNQWVTVGAVPGLIQDEAAFIAQLAPIVQREAEEIKTKLAGTQPEWFVPLGEIEFETSVHYHDLLSTLPGVERRAHPVRAYTTGNTAAHIIGTLGVIPADQAESYHQQGYKGDELVGLSGVEGWGEYFLAGRRGGKLITLGPDGNALAEIATAPVRPGGNVYLNLDMALQQRAEALLGARRGAIVLMESTGAVRALASYPRFLPQDFAMGVDVETWSRLLNDENRPLINRPTQGLYPPASVFKIVSMAAAMEYLGYSGETPFFCSGVWTGLGDDFVKKCWLETGHGPINLQDGITQSCDVVFYEVGLTMHRENPAWLGEMARAFGLGSSAGILGVESLDGVVPDNDWKLATRNEPFFDGDAVNMAIGQGDILATPLQIARLVAAMGNGGTLYRPQLVRRISSRDSGDQFFGPEVMGQLPISPQTLNTINQGLFNVVHGLYGTARKAFADWSYTAAGKTGTAETVIDQPHAWFAGYAPAYEPEIVIVVLLENAGEGSDEAAPLFRALADSYFAANS